MGQSGSIRRSPSGNVSNPEVLVRTRYLCSRRGCSGSATIDHSRWLRRAVIRQILALRLPAILAAALPRAGDPPGPPGWRFVAPHGWRCVAHRVL
jgi:hypothetical protein